MVGCGHGQKVIGVSTRVVNRGSKAEDTIVSSVHLQKSISRLEFECREECLVLHQLQSVAHVHLVVVMVAVARVRVRVRVRAGVSSELRWGGWTRTSTDGEE